MERDMYLGVDPGQSGGFVLLDPDGRVDAAWKMPATERDTADLLGEFAPRIRVAAIEAVHSMPGQGVSSSFKFGASYGGLRMALICLRIPFTGVSPHKWTSDMGLTRKTLSEGRTAKKNRNKARAQELWPGTKWTHATADAALIAEWIRRRER
jgi:crossover junction endodeoxyribonuclease RuvC